MQLTLPDEAIRQTGLSEQEFKLEIVAILYQKELVTLRVASAMAEVSELEFCQFLKGKAIQTYYDVDDLEVDLKTLGGIRQRGR